MAKRRTGVYVPRDVWDWLMGCGESFAVPADMCKPNGMHPVYWWRSELRRRIDEAMKPRKVRLMERTNHREEKQ